MMLHTCNVSLPSPSLPPPRFSSSAASSFLCPSGYRPKLSIVSTNASSSSPSSSPQQKQGQGEEELDHVRFQRVDMETAGAYRLIDRRTGNQVIVWGDARDSSSSSAPLPSHLLSSSPPLPPSPSPAAAPSRSSAVIAGGFSRLKAHKVKYLMMRNKKKPVIHDDHHPHQQQTDSESDSDDFNPIVNDRKRSNSSPSRGAAASASSLRGWGGVSSTEYYSYSFDRKKQLPSSPRKANAGGAGRGGFFSKTSFRNLGCSDSVIAALRSLGFLRPSHIQAMAFRSVLQGKSCVIADQSGSGKTLAYLCPIIQRLRQDEQAAVAQGKTPDLEHSSGCPRVIVLAPTAELASQVLNNCRLMSKSGVPFRSMVATGGFKQRTQLETLDQGLDVLIATPGRFLYLYQQGFLQLSHLQCVVLDEVDVLYGEEGFEQVPQSLISAAPMSVQYLFVTATLPLEIYNKVVEVFPDCEVIMGPGMHRTSSALEEVLVDCSGDPNEEKNPETAFTNKKNALLKLVQETSVRKTIVFCNKIETCRKVENVLKRVDRKEARIRVLPFHAALAQEARLANLKEFLKSQSADSMFLVCTDRASRGIDFKEVDHVVLFDFPREPSEYVRRVGRTARGAGGAGKAYVFAVGKQVSLAGRIIERNRKGHPLHDVPGAYELDR